MHNITEENWLHKLFINEAKSALKQHSGSGNGNSVTTVSTDEFIAWLNEAQVVEPIASVTGAIYTTNNNEIYIL